MSDMKSADHFSEFCHRCGEATKINGKNRYTYENCCKTIELVNLIMQYQEGIIDDYDRDALLRCLVCNANKIKKIWRARYKNRKLDDHRETQEEMEDRKADDFTMLFKTVNEALHKFDLRKIETLSNTSILNMFYSYHYYIYLNYDKASFNFKEDNILSPINLSTTAKDIGVINYFSEIDFTNYSLRAPASTYKNRYKIRKGIVDILNNKILKDVQFYDKVKHCIDDDSELDFVLGEVQIEIDRIKNKNMSFDALDTKDKLTIKRINNNLICSFFKSSIIRVDKYTPQNDSNDSLKIDYNDVYILELDTVFLKSIIYSYCSKRSLYWLIEGSRTINYEDIDRMDILFIIQLRSFKDWIENNNVLRISGYDVNNILAPILRIISTTSFEGDFALQCNGGLYFLKKLVIFCATRYLLWDFVNESIINIGSHSQASRAQLSRFHRHIFGPNWKEISHNCEGDRYEDLLADSEGRLRLFKEIEKCLGDGSIKLNKNELRKLKRGRK